MVNKKSHVFLMAAGCALVLVAVFALTTLTNGGSWGFYLLLLLCPAMHFLMHRGLHDSDNLHQPPHAQLPAPERQVSIEEQTK
jgi:hypothetical protein